MSRPSNRSHAPRVHEAPPAPPSPLLPSPLAPLAWPASFTVPLACGYLSLSLSRSGIYREIAAGRLTPFHIGSRVRLTRAECDRWLAERVAEAALDREALA